MTAADDDAINEAFYGSEYPAARVEAPKRDEQWQPIPELTDADAPGDPDSNGSPAPTPLDKRVEAERIRRQARRIVDAEERPAAGFPEIRTLTDLLAEGVPPIEWRIADMQPAGTRVVLAAQFKAGKTITVANLVRSLVDGDPFLGRFTVQPVDGIVAIVDFEMSPRQLLGWLQDQGIRNTDKVLPVCLRGNGTAFDILTVEGRQRWVDTLTQHHVEYVVWDCLRPVVDALGLDEHTGIGPLLVSFDQLLAEAGVPDASVIHHMGHANERSRGDSRIRDWPDVEWRLVRQDDDPSSPRFLSAYGRKSTSESPALSTTTRPVTSRWSEATGRQPRSTKPSAWRSRTSRRTRVCPRRRSSKHCARVASRPART